MQTDLVKKWVQELRSGKYKQGKGALRSIRPDGNEYYCCLGVLCDIAGVQWIPPTTTYMYRPGPGENIAFLPKELAARAGVTGVMQTRLTQLNDGPGWKHPASFDEIADIIEQELLNEH